jgi:nitroimidazol reductase NimA-like FMN-containing flavoprotein (pyridoxamine 5'-phosphate oxidase superfamily)
MDPVDLNTGMGVIDPVECMKLLATEELGRLAVVVAGMPEIFPINYVVDGAAIAFRSDGGTKLLGATKGPVVFEVDHCDRAAGSAWSVILHGRAHVARDFDNALLRQRISQLSLYPWAGGQKPFVFRVLPSSVTGRRIPLRASVMPEGVQEPRARSSAPRSGGRPGPAITQEVRLHV